MHADLNRDEIREFILSSAQFINMTALLFSFVTIQIVGEADTIIVHCAFCIVNLFCARCAQNKWR